MSDNWIKALGMGAGGRPLRDDWENERGGLLRRALTFSRKPGIADGDNVVLYSVAAKRFFAVGRATSGPYIDQADTSNWPWRVDIALDYACQFVHEGVPLDTLNIDGRDLRVSIRQHSHIRLSEAEFEAAIEALRS